MRVVRHLQTLDRVLVGHGSGLQQQFGRLHVVVADGEEESRPPLVIKAVVNTGVQHEVRVVTCIQQGLMGGGRVGRA